MTAVQNRYSMMYRDYEALFPVLSELQIGFVAFSPLANGFLSARYDQTSHFEKGTDYRSVMPQFSREGMEKNKKLMEELSRMAREKEPWIVPIPGTRKEDRLMENAGASELVLTKEEVCALDQMLDTTPMSEVFGGSRIAKQASGRN